MGLDKIALFRDLGYQPHPGQLAVHLSSAPRRVLACGVRYGKTLTGAMEAIAAALEPGEGSLGWIVCPSYDLCDRVLGQIEHAVKEHLEHRIVEFIPRERRILLCNLSGRVSEIRGKSADRPSSLLGEGLDYLIVDECARISKDVWEGHLSQRLVDRQGWALLTSTPRGGGWFHDLFVRGQGRDDQYESWSAPSWDNPFLQAEAIEAERRRLPEMVFRQEYGGEFIDVGIMPCHVCGDPQAGTSGTVVLQEGEELAKCDTCGAPVDEDEDGRGLRILFPKDPHLLVIELQDRRPATSPPGSAPVGLPLE